MSNTFFGKNGKTFDRNVYSGDFLSKITFGLFEKIGCHPKSEEDCKLVARILKNRANLNQYYSKYWKELFGVEKQDQETIEWMLELAEFFDTCGGCLSEEEYYKKYPPFFTWTLVGRWEYNLNQMIHAYIEGINKKESE